MSLKAFHVFFVLVSIVLSVGCGVWLFRRYQQSGGFAEVACAVLSFAAAVALIAYFVWFLRKHKRVSYI